jgi:NTE family protein
LKPSDKAPFQIFAGTSVGAINAAYLAANTHRGDLGIAGLIKLWESLEVHEYVKVDLLKSWWRRWRGTGGGWSLIDATPLALLVGDGIDWRQLHHCREAGTTEALVVTALDIVSGRTAMFAQIAAGVRFRPSLDPTRTAVYTDITVDHVLASAALPFVFPARRIGETYYCDGGLRYNTPIAPAIRSGAARLVIIPMLRKSRAPAALVRRYPNMTFLAGKLVNALIADPIERDLQVLERFNRLVEVLDETLTVDERERVAEMLRETRGRDYKTLATLTLRPSADIGLLAGQRVREGVGGALGFAFKQFLRRTGSEEADWASYLLFDGRFATRLIELGRHDAHQRADAIRRFFG